MRRERINSLLLLLVLFSAPVVLHAQSDTVNREKRLIHELTTQPELAGGVYSYLGKKIRYPPQARENGIEGRVFVRFLIDENGKITNVHLPSNTRRLGAGLEEEAVRVVKAMPAWRPGTYKEKAVRVVYTLPVYFKLE